MRVAICSASRRASSDPSIHRSTAARLQASSLSPVATLLQRISLGVGALVLLAAVVASALAVASSISSLNDSFERVERPAEVSRTLLRLSLSVVDAETAQRGFLVTGEAGYLVPYQGVRPQTDSLLTRLDTLVSWNPLQVRRMGPLRSAIGAKLDEMDEVLRLDASGDRTAALALVRTAQGARLMTATRDQIGAMLTEAQRMRRLQAARVVVARRRALGATLLTNGILAVLLLAGGLLLRRLLRARERSAEALLRHNAQLTQAVAEREAALVHVQSMQAQMVQQEKLAGLGRLTAGVAHELKNPLNFVNNFAALAGELAAETQVALDAGHLDEARALLPDLRLNAAKTAEHGARASDIVQAMLIHARGVSGEREPADLASILETSATQALGPADDEHRVVTVTQDVDLGEAQVIGIPSALGRLFLNLIENAVQATRERAGFELGFRPEVRLQARVGQDRLGRAVAIVTVEDNGPGVSDVALPRIFEPFYTTKAPGQGTGLGLSLAYDIAVGHGGTLAAGRSDLGGALFTVTLPLASAPDETGASDASASRQAV